MVNCEKGAPVIMGLQYCLLEGIFQVTKEGSRTAPRGGRADT